MGAVALVVALAVPAVALADGGSKCNASACKVYTEGPGTAGGGNGQGPKTTTVKPLKVSSKTAHLLSRAGKDKKVLSEIVRNPAYGMKRGLQKTAMSSIATPSALGSAFDLGSGPAVLLSFLLGSAVLLGLQGALRGWRRRRSRA